MKDIDLIVPMLNEEDSLPLFMQALIKEREHWSFHTQVYFIDDGSTDGSRALLRAYAQQYDWVHFIAFSRNFGKEVALSAGIDHCQGDAAVLLDVDLQHPLATIPEMVRLWQDTSIDMVYGVRNRDNQETPLKRFTSRWFYRFFNQMAHTRMPEGGGDFRLLDRKVINALKSLPERNRFMKGLYAWVGFTTQAITYEQPPRAQGESRFNYWKLWNFALDGIVSFTTWPLRVWSYLGGIVALLSFVYGGYIVIRTLVMGVDIPGYASLTAGVMFLGGMQLISIGIIGEYLGRLFIEAKERPLYIVAEAQTHKDTEHQTAALKKDFSAISSDPASYP